MVGFLRLKSGVGLIRSGCKKSGFFLAYYSLFILSSWADYLESC